jgi:hypothetical protein
VAEHRLPGPPTSVLFVRVRVSVYVRVLVAVHVHVLVGVLVHVIVLCVHVDVVVSVIVYVCADAPVDVYVVVNVTVAVIVYAFVCVLVIVDVHVNVIERSLSVTTFQLTVDLHSYVGHPYWPEMEQLINITKESGMNRARSSANRRAALEEWLRANNMTLADFERLEAEANRPFHLDDDGRIVIPPPNGGAGELGTYRQGR